MRGSVACGATCDIANSNITFDNNIGGINDEDRYREAEVHYLKSTGGMVVTKRSSTRYLSDASRHDNQDASETEVHSAIKQGRSHKRLKHS